MAEIPFVQAIVKENGKKVMNLIKGWAYFSRHEIVVGITEETAGREGSVNNAELAYIHENGSPANNIPMRPFLEPAMEQPEVLEKIQTLLHDAAEAALVGGDEKACEQNWEKAGMVGRDAVKAYIVKGVPPPNSPVTIARKGSSTPLIDTGSMMNAITYAVRKK